MKSTIDNAMLDEINSLLLSFHYTFSGQYKTRPISLQDILHFLICFIAFFAFLYIFVFCKLELIKCISLKILYYILCLFYCLVCYHIIFFCVIYVIYLNHGAIFISDDFAGPGTPLCMCQTFDSARACWVLRVCWMPTGRCLELQLLHSSQESSGL